MSAVGRSPFDNTFNTDNLCKLPFKNYFSTYIHELDLPDWPMNYDFSNIWSEGLFFYNILNDPSRDVRSYNPANIINIPSAGAYFTSAIDSMGFDFKISDRIIFPENIHAAVYQDATGWFLKISIDDYAKFPNLNADDMIYVMPQILSPDANNYIGPHIFTAATQFVTIPLMEGDQDKPFNILYFITDAAGINKTTATRFAFNHPDTVSYCELLFKNGMIHPDSVKIHDPYTAIWGELKDFIPSDLIPSITYKIISKNITTGEKRDHVISADFLFFCSKLLRNQIYTIMIRDGSTTVIEFDVVGFDDDYDFSVEKKRPRRVIKFKAGNELASKVK